MQMAPVVAVEVNLHSPSLENLRNWNGILKEMRATTAKSMKSTRLSIQRFIPSVSLYMRFMCPSVCLVAWILLSLTFVLIEPIDNRVGGKMIFHITVLRV